MTFSANADIALPRFSMEGLQPKRIDVFLKYYNNLLYKVGLSSSTNLAAGHKVKQFRNFLKNGNIKNHLNHFLVEHRSKDARRKTRSCICGNLCGYTRCTGINPR